MNKFCWLLILIFGCNTDQRIGVSLSEINIDIKFEGIDCVKILEWGTNDSFQLHIDILKNEYNQKYKKIVIWEFSSEGETVQYNSLVIFHDFEGNMTILSFGMDLNNVRKKIKMPSVSIEKIIAKLSYDGSMSRMSILEITKNNTNCYFKRNINYKDYKGLQDLSFFDDFY